ncbi:MAG: peroxide stress protein YaaA [Aeromicrobium sp.]|nr:MAG: peroxide stress protein YaaA [Aeromicrobium sp.]
MLILLPPSEGKTRPETGPALDLTKLSSPELNPVRQQLMNALVKLSGSKNGAEVLGLGPKLHGELEHNRNLPHAPTARADEIYTGVLFGELDPASLDPAARARLDQRVAIASALFGLVRPSDLIPAYRMSGSVTLPRLGTVSSRWKPVLPQAITTLADGGLVVDLRSGTYVALGKPEKHIESVTIRVLHEKDGKRSIVSHFNKATKGRIVRQLLTENVAADSEAEFVSALRDLGYTVESENGRIDVIVSEL